MKRAVLALAIAALVAGEAAAQWDPGSGSAGSAGSAGSDDPGSGSGSAGSGAGSGSAGSGSAGSGSAGSGSAGSGSSGPIIVQIPTDDSAPQVSAAASPTVVRLGGKFNVFVKATYGAGVVVNLAEPIQLGTAFEVLRKKSKDLPSGDGRTIREWEMEVAAWELGELVMPGIVVTYTAYGKVGQTQTNAVKLRVEGVLGELVDDPKAMRANAPPTELITRDWFWLWIAGAGLFTLGMAITILLLVRNSRLKRVRLVAGVVATPRRMDMTSARALERLMAIEKAGTLEREEQRRDGYAEMVEVLREYLGNRYHVATFDLTSRELVRRLEPLAPAEERGLIASWLETCDLVKYGGLRTTTTEAKRTLDDGRALVVTTTEIHGAGKSKPDVPAAPDEEAA
ncbi:MAG: hypothetical protein WKG01_09705 [Kofleriaceae bacterium]